MNSRYSGINGIQLNPAVTVSSPYYLDINILSAGIFEENNYVYFSKQDYRFLRFFEKNAVYPTHAPDFKTVYDLYSSPDKNGYGNVRIMGPSASLTIGRHAFGFFTAARSATSFRNVPYEMAKFFFEGLHYDPQEDINYVDNQKISVSNLEWAETGFNYSCVVKNTGLDYWTAGATIKILLGYAGAYARSNHVDYEVLDSDTLQVNSVTGEAGYALPLNYRDNTFLNAPLFRGKGVGFDLGVTYEKKKKSGANDERFSSLCAQTYAPYYYRIGFSLLDLGSIKFSRNAQKLNAENAGTFWPGISHNNFISISSFVSELSYRLYSDSSRLISGNTISIGLPAAASLQADWNYKGNWYLNGTFVYPLPLMKTQVVRPVLMAVSPRYETEDFDLGFVASLYDWNKIHFGLNARYRGFFIGSEKVSSFFHFTDFTGLDLYFGLKIRLIKGNCPGVNTGSSCGINEYMKYQKSKRETRPRKWKRLFRRKISGEIY